jgi:hypothetical protein
MYAREIALMFLMAQKSIRKFVITLKELETSVGTYALEMGNWRQAKD